MPVAAALAMRSTVWLGLSLLEGASVLVLELVGARVLAPVFGTSQVIWTAQITATLLLLALGYELGGRLCRRRRTAALSALLAFAGLWTFALGLLRAPLLSLASQLPWLALASFVAACALFGPSLLALGALSPALIQRLEPHTRGAGSAAGRVLFTSTAGGLLGGWLTALVLVPRVSLSHVLLAVASLLLALAVAWARLTRTMPRRASWVGVGAAALVALSPEPATRLTAAGIEAQVIASHQGSTGLVQVIDVPSADARFLVVDGTVQGGEHRATGESIVEFSDSLLHAGVACQPKAQTALVVGLGAGTLARHLSKRGIRVTAAEIDARVIEASRRHFALPASVSLQNQDGRVVLEASSRRFDLVLLDVYRGESFPWHLATVEAFQRMRDRLTPDGCLLINAIAFRDGTAPGLARLEAGLLAAFPSARVFYGGGDAKLVNATLVAPREAFPTGWERALRAEHFRVRRDARATVRAPRDDHSDLDHSDQALRGLWRRGLLAELDPRALVD